MSDAVEKADQPVVTRQQAVQAIINYFLANAEAGNHPANDELIAELARRRRIAHDPGCGDRNEALPAVQAMPD